jgi:DNA-binding transcriptional MerR regulator
LPGALKRQDPMDPISSERLYYRIGEVSRITGLKPHVLRYWESEFRAIRPYKTGSLQRLYRKRDLEIVLRIKKLLYEEGFTIAGARKKMRDLEKEDGRRTKSTPAEKGPDEKERELLFVIREELEGIRDMLEESSLPPDGIRA